ncbi:MAG: hypothetical protein UT28_C0001G0711 [Berkelbacteria bacterium GW2011_GWE1_39_12]|uniref:tRNA threonylcarbamoyladenosine biosynthesis protein TsaE n=1 Tax=Berkelbacteria bacterium GW2011_GWE1_39_12 TaxID=1618337 RepID=A0A0G4B517_9BACT|nr:MAG: hypothetical protein UT28_C0001G0711 [Berkelbacteria bacterium GW2011_GWE1_39_12]
MITKSSEETIEIALKLAADLKGGEILALHGDLGGGKTTFTKGLAEGLKVNDTVTSPTFVLLKVYSGKIDDKKIELVHVDAYRVESIDDIKSVGIEDYLDRQDIILVVEWAEKIKEILPKNVINIYFERIEKQGSAKAGSLDENERKIKIDFAN